MFFFFNDTATTEIYTLSLHDALPISYYSNKASEMCSYEDLQEFYRARFSKENWMVNEVFEDYHYKVKREINTETLTFTERELDRKSTRLNSSHANISYAVFCLKKTNH